MSTIASPRDAPRRINSQPAGATPTSSTRPSLDTSRSPIGSPSLSGSPNPLYNSGTPTSSTPTSSNAPPTKRNRAALREYYNLKKAAAASSPPHVEVTDPFGETAGNAHENEHYSEVPPSEMDKDGFDAEAFVRKALVENGMEDLLRLYTRVLGETRALDAEKKALVYDNYSKLITATETIRKVSSFF